MMVLSISVTDIKTIVADDLGHCIIYGGCHSILTDRMQSAGLQYFVIFLMKTVPLKY